jgi:hypothetical protein
MGPRLAGTLFNNCRQLAPMLLFLVGLSSCNLFKKGETSTQPAESAAAAVSAAPSTSTSLVNNECAAACRKIYRDCVGQLGDASRAEGIGKCREALRPCVAACKIAPQ